MPDRPAGASPDDDPRTGPAGLSASPSILRRLIGQRGLTQAEFAARCGVSKDHLSRILRGRVRFPGKRRTLLRIAAALGVLPDVFQEFRTATRPATLSARTMASLLAERGIGTDTFLGRVSRYSEGHLRAILAGRRPFPQDPAAVEDLARACEASPLEFAEYHPSDRERERLLHAAEAVLDAHDYGVFRHLLDKVTRRTPSRAQPADRAGD